MHLMAQGLTDCAAQPLRFPAPNRPLKLPVFVTSRFALIDDDPRVEEAEQIRFIADMAHVVAHRIRGLVTTIEGFTDLLAESLGEKTQRELALRIFESAARIESVLADLQMFSRPVQPVAVETTLDVLLADLHAALDEEITLRADVSLGGAATPLLVDRVLIRQALLVLVQNAAEATPPEAVLHICSAIVGRHAVIEVSNPGALDPAITRDAFKPFFTTKAHNLGLGLPIACRIARAHGGSVTLEEGDGATTRFMLHLPLAPAGEV